VGDAITYGYQFRGARIVDAVLASLVSTKGMGASGPARLLFGGCSAGGRGAAFSLDYVDAALERAGAAPGAVTVYGLLDAALWIDVPPEFDGIVSQQCQTAALAEMVNATRLGDACMAAYPGVESWKCLFGEYRAHSAILKPRTLIRSRRHAFRHHALHHASQPAGHLPDRDQHQCGRRDASPDHG